MTIVIEEIIMKLCALYAAKDGNKTFAFLMQFYI
jgi:hypothetical protein